MNDLTIKNCLFWTQIIYNISSLTFVLLNISFSLNRLTFKQAKIGHKVPKPQKVNEVFTVSSI